jgi:osmotically-inducible protein OsmY
MRNLGLFGFIAAAFFVVIMANGCDTFTANSNANGNVANANRNTNAVLVNANTNRPANVNRWSNVNANMTREEYDKNRAEYEADKGGSTIGGGINDSWLWFKTRAALLTTSDLRQSTINVDVENDVVTLRGTVETPAQKVKAEQVAKGIEGVKKVNNQLKVAPEDSVTNMNGSNR